MSASWDFADGAEITPGRTALRSLGTGDLYDTYLVWDDHRFAITVAKVLRPDRVADADARRALQREAGALRRLQHPVLVRSFDAVLEGPHPHVLLEHLEGPTLSHLLRRHGPLPLEQLLPVALHMASVLRYLEREGVVHLDIKPGNIIMGMPPRLIDLSLLRTIDEAAEISDRLGTDPYMAPEQCDPSALGPIGSAADVFGLGATLYHAITGAIPFPPDPEDPPTTLSERFPQLTDDPAPLAQGAVPDALAELTGGMLSREPALRPRAEQVAAALQPLVDALPRRLVIGKRGLEPRR
jgi:serine/threonine protein kinase